jgi:hypothetical protein
LAGTDLSGNSTFSRSVLMTRLIVDEFLRSRLNNFAEPLELCDASGRVLARLVPVVDWLDLEPCEPEISDEELREREQSDEWLSSDQVQEHLRRLEGA